jgi:hypothetical protein
LARHYDEYATSISRIDQRGKKMFAVRVDVEITDAAAAMKYLNEDVLPNIRNAPGVVSGCWIALDDNHGTSFVIFETEEQARAGAPTEGSTSPGVTFTSVVFGGVIAQL